MIELDRLQLVPLSPEDFLGLIDGVDSFRQQFGVAAAEGLRDFIVSDDVSSSFLELLKCSSGTDPWRWGFAVIDPACDLVVGNGGFKGPPDSDGVVEIAYGIVPNFENQGYATETALGLVSYAYADSRVITIRAHTLPEFNASTRVLTKIGFEKVGEVVDPEDGEVWRWQHLSTQDAP